MNCFSCIKIKNREQEEILQPLNNINHKPQVERVGSLQSRDVKEINPNQSSSSKTSVGTQKIQTKYILKPQGNFIFNEYEKKVEPANVPFSNSNVKKLNVGYLSDSNIKAEHNVHLSPLDRDALNLAPIIRENQIASSSESPVLKYMVESKTIIKGNGHFIHQYHEYHGAVKKNNNRNYDYNNYEHNYNNLHSDPIEKFNDQFEEKLNRESFQINSWTHPEEKIGDCSVGNYKQQISIIMKNCDELDKINKERFEKIERKYKEFIQNNDESEKLNELKLLFSNFQDDYYNYQNGNQEYFDDMYFQLLYMLEDK